MTSIAISGVFVFPSVASAAAVPETVVFTVSQFTTRVVANRPDPGSIDLNRAADKADEASKTIFHGFEDTKRTYDQPGLADQAVGHGRSNASHKLHNLADRARSADKGIDDELSPQDLMMLKRFDEVN